MKQCIRCDVVKPITEFYKHKKMGDGHLNKCKDCTKSDTLKRYQRLMSNPEGMNAEKARHRDKYHRLGYKDKHRPTAEKKKIIMSRYKDKYPEKQKAKNLSAQLKPSITGNQLHHWSYKLEHAKDVIELSVKDHNTAHTQMSYDTVNFYYIDPLGNHLDTNEKHREFLISLGLTIHN